MVIQAPMFEFFSKKNFLVDRLEHFVDIHNHVLPGIDDGAKDVSESVELLKAFQELGIISLYTTPHIFPQLYPNDPESISTAHDKLMEALITEEMTGISLKLAAEHMVDDSFEEMLSTDKHMSLKGEFLLFEMSFLQPPINFDQAVMAINRKRLTPILAHPERYHFLHSRSRTFERYMNQGILLQVNLLSLGEHYGKDVHKMAWKLMDENLVDFVGSDIHGMRHFQALKQVTLPNRRLEQVNRVIHNTIEVFY